jgi:hypothetical protein
MFGTRRVGLSLQVGLFAEATAPWASWSRRSRTFAGLVRLARKLDVGPWLSIGARPKRAATVSLAASWLSLSAAHTPSTAIDMGFEVGGIERRLNF